VTQRVLFVTYDSGTNLPASYRRAFRALGWDTITWNPTAAVKEVSRGGPIGAAATTLLQVQPWLRTAWVQLLRLAEETRPDLVIVMIQTNVAAGSLAQLRVCLPKTPVYCIYSDSPHYLDSERVNCLPFFDRVAVSSPQWVDAFQRLGARSVHYLPFAVDTDLHFPVAPSGPIHDIGFVGNWRPDREAFLEQLADLDLWIWGADYWKNRTHRDSPLRVRWMGRAAHGEAYAQVCADTKIMLNTLDVVTRPGPNMRTFEQPGCGAFSLVERSPATLELFEEGRTIECFESVTEAREKITYYMSHDEQRHKIAKAGYDFVINCGHTYLDRAREVLTWVTDDGKKS
jgi:spore maturation protein CgeB